MNLHDLPQSPTNKHDMGEMSKKVNSKFVENDDEEK